MLPLLLRIFCFGCVCISGFLATVQPSNAACDVATKCDAEKSRWSPRGKLEWSIDYATDLAKTRLKLQAPEAFVVPLSTIEQAATEKKASAISSLKCGRNKKLVCYTNCGAYEAGHWNEALLAPVRHKMLGRSMDGYPDERWLNIKELGIMRELIRDKFAKAAAQGCDAVLCDNTEAWITGTDGKGSTTISIYRERGINAVKQLAAGNVKANTGFDITFDDQIRFNTMLAEEAHLQCLAIGLVNDVFQIEQLADQFDFALNEQCHHCGWCDLYRPFVRANKPVLHLEFHDNEGFCKSGSPSMTEICKANRTADRTTFSSLKRAASSKLHLPDRPQTCN